MFVKLEDDQNSVRAHTYVCVRCCVCVCGIHVGVVLCVYVVLCVWCCVYVELRVWYSVVLHASVCVCVRLCVYACMHESPYLC